MCRVELPKQLPCAADDAAEGVSGGDVRSEPGVLPVSVAGGCREGDHAGAAGPVDAARRTSSLTAGKRSRTLIVVLQGYGVRIDLRGRYVHQQSGDHEQHVHERPRRAGHELRADPPRGPLLGARSERKPLQGEAPAARHVHRPGRRAAQGKRPVQVTGCPTTAKKASRTHKKKARKADRVRTGHSRAEHSDRRAAR